MKKKLLVLIALILVLCMTLTGCGLDFRGYFQQLLMMSMGGAMTNFADMVYTRPDMDNLQKVVDECCAKVAEAKNFNAVVAVIYEAYGPIDEFSTAYALSNIYYCKDLTDGYWAEEYAFCAENASVAQAALDKFYRALAKSQYRTELEGDDYFGAGFFDDYEGESFYDEVFTGMLAEEAALENRYYTLCEQAAGVEPGSQEFYTGYGAEMEQLFVELIALRQEMADYLGYASYPEFAYDFYYGRDYTVDQTTSYLADIRAELVPLYELLCENGVDATLGPCDGKEALDYVREMAYAMGGTMRYAYESMINHKLYDIDYNENKYDASFEVYISGYHSPYIFMNPTLSEYDKLTFTHEFGHFCADYANNGSAAGIDVAEVFSQGMEYLSLCYVADPGDLEIVKLVDCLSVMVEQSAYASFEQMVYGLEGEELTVENVRALFAQVSQAYGFGSLGIDSRVYVQITHFFTNPLYVISYVVSNDVAMQLYELEQAQAGTGVAAMEQAFYTAESGIVAFATANGLESPFADGRIHKLKETLQNVLN